VDQPLAAPASDLDFAGTLRTAPRRAKSPRRSFRGHHRCHRRRVAWAAVTVVTEYQIGYTTFQVMDLVFYAVAVYEGYRFSFGRLSPGDAGGSAGANPR